MKRHAQARTCFIVSVTTCVLLVGTLQAMRVTGVFDLESIPVVQGPSSLEADRFLNIDGASMLDQHVYYHGLEDVGEHIRSADTIFVGNSRLLFGIPESAAVDFFEARGRDFYLLGFPAEHDMFTLEILQKWNARPEFVVVNADDFFRGQISVHAYHAVSDDHWQARKLSWEASMSYRFRKQLHRWFPHLSTLYAREQTFLVFRSPSTGAWHVEAGKGQPSPVDSEPPEETVVPDRHLKVAREFQKTVNGWGGRVILTYVPTVVDNRWRAEVLAEHLGVPLIAPQPADLTTSDGSHLDEPSARRFSAALFAELNDVIPASTSVDSMASR